MMQNCPYVINVNEFSGRIWKPVNRPELGLSNRISELIAERESENSRLFTSLRNGPTLILASDYSGHHASATHEALSFLLVDSIYLWRWDEMRQSLRTKVLGKRRLSFKDLRDFKRRKVLSAFLEAANTIPGLSLTVLIDKKINSLFTMKDKLDMSHPALQLYAHWKERTFERLLRVGHLGALLISCMCAPGQEIMWFTDHDDIVANDERLIEGTEVIGHLLGHYLQNDIKHFRFGSAASDDGSLLIEDLIAIPDLIAGSLSELISTKTVPTFPVLSIFPGNTRNKTKNLVTWLADSDNEALKRMVLVMDLMGEGNIQLSTLDFIWHGITRINKTPM